MSLCRHLRALRAPSAIRTKPVGEQPCAITLPPRKPGDARGAAAQAEGEATRPGDCDAATAVEHHAAKFPLRWGSGAALPALERADAGQAEHEGLPRPDHNGRSVRGMQTAGAARRPVDSPPSPGPPPLPPLDGTGRAESRSPKNRTPSPKSGTPSPKNGTRSCHVVVKDHDSKQDDFKTTT